MSYVLVVDDEAAIRVLAARWLQRMGHGVKAAASAGEAIELVRLEPPAALVCDIGLPDHDGFWLVRQVREQAPTTPVVMMSGYIDLPGEAQNVEHIAKPFGRDILAAALQRAMTQPIADGDSAQTAHRPERSSGASPLSELRASEGAAPAGLDKRRSAPLVQVHDVRPHLEEGPRTPPRSVDSVL